MFFDGIFKDGPYKVRPYLKTYIKTSQPLITYKSAKLDYNSGINYLNDTLNLPFALEKKKKKKYNGSIMSDRLKPPVRLNLGGKTLAGIVKGLEDLGWRTNKTVLQVNGDPVMFYGNLNEAKFRHRPLGRGKGHIDALSYVRNELLIRQCPDDGSEVLSSNEVEVVQG